MIDKPLLPHFLVRQGTRDYMVYDRFTPGPAKLGGHLRSDFRRKRPSGSGTGLQSIHRVVQENNRQGL